MLLWELMVERVINDYDVSQPWGALTKQGDKTSARAIYKKAAVFARDGLREFKRKLQLSTKKINKEKILIDIKKLDSFVEKITNRNRSAEKITDLLRAAILVHEDSHVEIVTKALNKNFDIVKHDYKTADNTSGGYYGAHHFLVLVGEDEQIVAEIQLMTKRLWSYKSEAHKIYDKYKVEDNPDTDIKRFDDNRSKELFKVGNKPKEIKNKRRDSNGSY